MLCPRHVSHPLRRHAQPRSLRRVVQQGPATGPATGPAAGPTTGPATGPATGPSRVAELEKGRVGLGREAAQQAEEIAAGRVATAAAAAHPRTTSASASASARHRSCQPIEAEPLLRQPR